MTDWQERITRDTAPAIQIEHELRYRAAEPLIRASGVWADLGCGNGIAASAALADVPRKRVVLVDVETSVVARAASELGAPDARQLVADLTDPGDLARIAEELTGAEAERIVTCFEVIEHLATFTPLIEWATALAREHGVTFVISVPNDAFWSISNPYHSSSWGEGSIEELRRLLPSEQTLVRQVALTGSVFVSWEAESHQHELVADVGGGATIATHFIAAFGPRHGALQLGALAAQADQLAQRRWERQRESNLALAEARLRELDGQFEAWRAYIQKLESELATLKPGAQAGK